MEPHLKKYRPSNSTEGMGFIDHYCCNCIHGKYEHTGDTNDNPCEILIRSFFLDINDKDYPEEWQYNENNEPVCTAWKKWDWGRDDDGNFNEPPESPIDDPRQLCFPFILDELNINQKQTLQTCKDY